MKGYSTDIITDKSVDFIQRHKDQPFFLYVAHQTPHNPYQTRADTPENRKEDWKQNRVGDENRPRYREMLKDLDDSVGKILDTLSEWGWPRTRWCSCRTTATWDEPEGSGVRGGKFSQYEGGHRVPAVAWWPGKIKAGTSPMRCSPASTCSRPSPRSPRSRRQSGQSRRDQLQGPPSRARLPDRDIFFGYEPKLGTAMRRGDWKMIVKGDDVQLYNLKNDPKETTNVAAEHPEIAGSMRQAIERFRTNVTPGKPNRP